MADSVVITQPKDCDICAVQGVNPVRRAEFDFRTKDGRWANGCKVHYYDLRLHDTLGTGKGQRLILKD